MYRNNKESITADTKINTHDFEVFTLIHYQQVVVVLVPELNRKSAFLWIVNQITMQGPRTLHLNISQNLKNKLLSKYW